MSKLRLEMEALAVESFATGIRVAGTGTVRGRWDVPREGDSPGDMAITPPPDAGPHLREHLLGHLRDDLRHRVQLHHPPVRRLRVTASVPIRCRTNAKARPGAPGRAFAFGRSSCRPESLHHLMNSISRYVGSGQ